MSQDNHRTPGRLASPFHGPNRRPSRRSQQRQSKPPPDEIIDAHDDDRDYYLAQDDARSSPRPQPNGYDAGYRRDPDMQPGRYTSGHDRVPQREPDAPPRHYTNGHNRGPRRAVPEPDDRSVEPVEAGLPPREPPPPIDRPAPPPGELSKKERHQLLMHTIQLYDVEWKLGGIRADEQHKWLIAYLMPRNKRLDLKTALSRGRVLKITIDSRGNTDIQEPKKRGPFKLFASLFS